MSYVAPLGTIVLYKNVPLDITFDHTIYFASRSAQNTYFNSLTKYTFLNQTYTRVKKGVIRVARAADLLYDYNYLSFVNPITQGQNSGQNGKKFYCFITYIEYINNEVTEIGFEIDPMQTWLPEIDYTLGDSFVEREHSSVDTIGSNLVPENLELGEYVHDNVDGTGKLGGKKIIVAATFDKQYQDVSGATYGGLFSGLEYNYFDTAQEAADFIAGVGAKAGGIVGVYYAPTNFITNKGESVKSYTITKNKATQNIYGSYSPKNNKLYTYPFNFLYVTNFQGDYKIYQYEYFSSGNTCSFTLAGDYTSKPTVILAPINYKGEASTNYNEMITISGWPQCAYNTDIFKAWLAQSVASFPFTALGQTMGSVGGLAVAGAKAGATGVINTVVAGAETMAGPVALIAGGVLVAGVLAQGAGKVMQGNAPHGMQSGTTLAALSLLDFGFYNMRIRPEFARIIDEYFTMYGYATHRIKKPNIHVRTHWTYTKTIGCKIEGSMPCDIEDKICKIFDHGITFWVNGSEVGNYHEYINSPLGT